MKKAAAQQVAKVPAIYVQRNFVVNGGLMSYGPDQAERYGASHITWTES